MRAKQGGELGRAQLPGPGRARPGSQPRPARAGLRPGDRVAILSENRPEWAIADYACLAARCTDVPIYPTLPAKQVEYILADSGVGRGVRLDPDAAGQGAGGAGAASGAASTSSRSIPDVAGPGVLPLEQLYARGRAARPAAASWRADALQVKPDDLATLIYTSGTTGDMKGVMLTHGNIASNVTTCCTLFSFTRRRRVPVVPAAVAHLRADVRPLLHAALRRDHQLRRERRHGGGGHAALAADADGLGAAAVREDLRPGAGRGARRVGAEARIFFWGKRVGETAVELRLAGRPVAAGASARSSWLADRLVFAKLRARTGGRLRFFISGGAPLSADIAKFFHAAGMPILEGYGLTETSPVIAVNTFKHQRLGTVGPADPRGRGEDRAGRRDPHPRPARHEGLLQQARGHRRGDRRRRLVPHRRHRRCSTRTASSRSPTGRRTSSSPRAARTSRRSRSRAWSRPTSSSPAP